MCPDSSPNTNSQTSSPSKSWVVVTNILSIWANALLARTKLSISSDVRSNSTTHSGVLTVPTLLISSGSDKAEVKLKFISEMFNLVNTLFVFSNSRSKSPLQIEIRLLNFLVS